MSTHTLGGEWPRPTRSLRHIVRSYSDDLSGHAEHSTLTGAYVWVLDARQDGRVHSEVTRGEATSWAAARAACDAAAMAYLTRGGRPAIGPKIEVRLDPEALAEVEAAAALLGLSRAEWCRRVLTAQAHRALDPRL